MEQRIANIISVLFHPLLMPLVGFLIIDYSGTHAGLSDIRLMYYAHMLVFGLTLVLPAAIIPIYYYARLIRSVKMPGRRERIIPFYITLVFYLVAYL